MATITDVRIGDLLTLSISLRDLDKGKQRTIFGISASPKEAHNPEVLVIDDKGEERWIFLRTFEGFYDVKPVVRMSSQELH